MLGLFLTDVEPFHTVYLHGIVRDPYGQKMSKTKGNVVDPLDMVGEIGADALRLALVSGNAPGVDQRLTDARLTGARNFTNKLWNAARFVIGARPATMVAQGGQVTLADRWIRSRLAAATERATRQLDELDLAGYVATVHEIVWSDYCDQFLEMAKVDLRREGASDADRTATWLAAADTLGSLLRLLHPIVPFVTEEIWAALLSHHPEAASLPPLLVTAAWPSAGAVDPAVEAEMAVLTDLIRSVRNLRTEQGATASAWLPMTVVPADDGAHAVIEGGLGYLSALARVRPIDLRAAGDDSGRPETVLSTATVLGWLGSGVGDAEAAARRASREAELRGGIDRLQALLAGEFASRAPEAVVERERARLAELEAQLRLLTAD